MYVDICKGSLNQSRRILRLFGKQLSHQIFYSNLTINWLTNSGSIAELFHVRVDVGDN
jgi:hypothetical protein